MKVREEAKEGLKRLKLEIDENASGMLSLTEDLHSGKISIEDDPSGQLSTDHETGFL